MTSARTRLPTLEPTGFLTCLLLVAVAAGIGTNADAAELDVDPEASLVAVVTRKAGFAAGMAHDHLIAFGGPYPRVGFDAERPQDARFVLEFPVAALVVDPWERQQAWQSRLVELGILDKPFAEISEKNRNKIRRAMESPKQLDAEQHPTLRAELVGVDSAKSGEFPFRATVRLTVRGQTAETVLVARHDREGTTSILEAWGELRFTQFGIKPYSAMLGAVKNQDRFYVYVKLVVPASVDGAESRSGSARLER